MVYSSSDVPAKPSTRERPTTNGERRIQLDGRSVSPYAVRNASDDGGIAVNQENQPNCKHGGRYCDEEANPNTEEEERLADCTAKEDMSVLRNIKG